MIIVPGLGGHNREIYIISQATEALKRDYQPVIVNWRGSSGQELTTSKLSTLLSDEDIQQGVEYVRDKIGARPKLFLVGTSMGGCVSANYIAKN